MANETMQSKTPVKVGNLNGFDKSHSIFATAKPGQLIPVLVDEVLPNSTITLGAEIAAKLPPFATDFNGKIDVRCELFFVPSRILWKGWESHLARQNQYDPSLAAPANRPELILRPQDIPTNAPSLLNDMGLQHVAGETGGYDLLPVLAYNKVWADYYRDSRIQKDPFCPTDIAVNSLANLPYKVNSTAVYADATFRDGAKVSDYRYRNYDRDYFTTAMLYKQLGQDMRVTVESSGAFAHTFTIEQLREINALQRFNEVLAQSGNSAENVQLSLYGCTPMNKFDHAIYLGQMRKRLLNNGIFSDSNAYDYNGDTITPYDNGNGNYFIGQGVGGFRGYPMGQIQGSLCGKFHTRDHGFLICIASIVPIANYLTGTRRMFRHVNVNSLGNARLAVIGNQPIIQAEVANTSSWDDSQIFGWTDRFAEYKFINDRATNGYLGNFRPFIHSRQIAAGSTLNSAFIKINDIDLDDVLAVRSDSGRTTRLNIGFEYKVSQPLPSYSIPTLGDLDDYHTVAVEKGGRHI